MRDLLLSILLDRVLKAVLMSPAKAVLTAPAASVAVIKLKAVPVSITPMVNCLERRRLFFFRRLAMRTGIRPPHLSNTR